ncbi:uncharacterized protein LOC134252241 [Saccostrea cucullata]|uniref:uncharacterized protein LOC134252241 n=1 Tax=Saccostrea cuccullata TaxID=36930 RepID=UPI002ED3AE16
MYRSYRGSVNTSISESNATYSQDYNQKEQPLNDQQSPHLTESNEKDRETGLIEKVELIDSPRIRSATDSSEDLEHSDSNSEPDYNENMETTAPKVSRKNPLPSTSNRESIHESVTKCSICMNKFRNPKSLPCLHTFCMSCLSRYVTQFIQEDKAVKWSGFPCPTCRTTAIPTDTTVDASMWAEQFPTNNFILSVMDMVSFDKAEKTCEPCDRQHKKGVKADMWCKHCKVCLCRNCLSFHNAMFPDHGPVSITKVTREPTTLWEGQNMQCTRHKENLNLFCNDHQVLACPTCVAVEHRRCLRVMTSEDYAKELKSTEELDRVVQQYSECLQSLDDIVQENLRQSTHITNRKQEIVSKIKECRRQINSHLDDIQNNFLDKLNETHREEVDKIDNQVREIKILQSAVENSKKMVEATITYGGDSQLLSTILKAKSNSLDYKQKAIETSEKTEDVDFSFKMDKQVRDLPTVIQEFGEIKIVRAKRGIPKSISSMKPMFGRKAKEIHRFFVRLPSDNIDCVITSGLYLPDGRLIVCDFHNRCVKMFRDTGVFITKLLLQSEPFGICKVDNATVAVTQPNVREITTIAIADDQMNEVNSIVLGKVCYGIEKFNDELLVLLPMEKPLPCLNIIELDGTVNDTIKKDSAGRAMFEHRPFHITVNKYTNEIYVTQKTTAARDKRGLILREDFDVKSEIHHKDIRWARGVDIDFEGNVYICGQTSSNVVQFTPDCSQSRAILTTSGGIQHPAAIGFNHNKFFLTDVGDDNRNVLKIFELS